MAGLATHGLSQAPVARSVGGRVTADRLRSLWDFDDLAVTETRMRAQLDDETTDAGRAEVLSL